MCSFELFCEKHLFHVRCLYECVTINRLVARRGLFSHDKNSKEIAKCESNLENWTWHANHKVYSHTTGLIRTLKLVYAPHYYGYSKMIYLESDQSSTEIRSKAKENTGNKQNFRRWEKFEFGITSISWLPFTEQFIVILSIPIVSIIICFLFIRFSLVCFARSLNVLVSFGLKINVFPICILTHPIYTLLNLISCERQRVFFS